MYGIIGLTTRVQRCVWYYRLNYESAEVCMVIESASFVNLFLFSI